MIKNVKHKKSSIKLVFAVIIVFIIMWEVYVSILLLFPRYIPAAFMNYFKSLYVYAYRNYIQFEPSYSRYDPELFYRLKPGNFFVSSPEFNNRFSVNGKNFRDDEDSLVNPAVVVLGDSFALGWGVDQHQVYSQKLEILSGLKVLNAGMASYGTAREVKLLDQIDTRGIKWLIIHYYDNDYAENKSFSDNGNSLKISSSDNYDRVVDTYAKRKRYYLGKYTMFFLSYITDAIKRRVFGSTHSLGILQSARDNAAELFLNVLMCSKNKDIKKAKLIVIADYEFLFMLKKQLQIQDYPDYIADMRFASMPNQQLDKDCYYKLDDHINARGHDIIAARLLAIIRSRLVESSENAKI